MTLRRIVLAAACAAVAATAFASTASTASARTLAQARAVCPDGAICLFEHANFDGKYVASRYAINRLSDFGFNDRTTSWVNDSPNAFCMLENEIRLPFSNGGQWIWTSGWGSNAGVRPEWNDRISAVKRMVRAGQIC